MSNEAREAKRIERNKSLVASVQQHYATDPDEPAIESKRHGIPLSPVRHVDPKTLVRNPRNTFHTLTETDLARLQQDIAQRGILVPMIVSKDKRTLLAGHNRLHVALELGLHRVPVQFVEIELDDAAERRLLVADNVLRRQLSEMERTAYLAELYPSYFEDSGRAGRRVKSDHGDPITAAEVAKEIGVSVPTIKRAKALHKAAKETAAKFGKAKPDRDDYHAAKEVHLSVVRPSSPSDTLDGILAEEALRHTDERVLTAIERIRDRCLEAGLIR